MGELRPAAFLDRDGTIIEDRDYIADPADVVVLDQAIAGMRTLRDAGYLLIVVTNQSGIARGLVSTAEFEDVQTRLVALLHEQGIALDGVYHCPHHPDYTGPCECRKPALGMYRQAALEHGIDLARSVYIGDKLSDVEPAIGLGGTGILVRTGYGRSEEAQAGSDVMVADDLGAAARLVLRRDPRP